MSALNSYGDKESALKLMTDEKAKSILEEFTDNALKTNSRDLFEVAANVIYGKRRNVYAVELDPNRRMYFQCLTCNKPTNNLRSLKEHSISGGHAKNNLYRESLEKPSKERTIFTDKQSLQYRISVSKIVVLGLHKVEEYNHKNSRKKYYVCTLCHSHGKAEEMFTHLTGNKHTDNYIIHRVNLPEPDNIDEEVRDFLRKSIYDKDNKTANDIVEIKEHRFYPYALEDESKPRLDKGRDWIRKKDHDNDNSYSSSSCFSLRSHFGVTQPGPSSASNNNVDDTPEMTSVTKNTTNDSANGEEGRKTSQEDFIYTLCMLIEAHKYQEDKTRLTTKEDFMMCCKLMFFCLTLVYFSNQKRSERSTSNIAGNRVVLIKSCLGILQLFMEKKTQ